MRSWTADHAFAREAVGISRAGRNGFDHAPPASLQKRTATLRRGRIDLGTPDVSRYASVSTTTSGRFASIASATLFTSTSWLAASEPPSASRSFLHVGH